MCMLNALQALSFRQSARRLKRHVWWSTARTYVLLLLLLSVSSKISLSIPQSTEARNSPPYEMDCVDAPTSEFLLIGCVPTGNDCSDNIRCAMIDKRADEGPSFLARALVIPPENRSCACFAHPEHSWRTLEAKSATQRHD